MAAAATMLGLDTCVPLVQSGVEALAVVAQTLAAVNKLTAQHVRVRKRFHLVAQARLDAIRRADATLARARAQQSLQRGQAAVEKLATEKEALDATVNSTVASVDASVQQVAKAIRAREAKQVAALEEQVEGVRAQVAKASEGVSTEASSLQDMEAKYQALQASQRAHAGGDTMVRFDELEREHVVFALRAELMQAQNKVADAQQQLRGVKQQQEERAAAVKRKREAAEASLGQLRSQVSLLETAVEERRRRGQAVTAEDVDTVRGKWKQRRLDADSASAASKQLREQLVAVAKVTCSSGITAAKVVEALLRAGPVGTHVPLTALQTAAGSPAALQAALNDLAGVVEVATGGSPAAFLRAGASG